MIVKINKTEMGVRSAYYGVALILIAISILYLWYQGDEGIGYTVAGYLCAISGATLFFMTLLLWHNDEEE